MRANTLLSGLAACGLCAACSTELNFGEAGGSTASTGDASASTSSTGSVSSGAGLSGSSSGGDGGASPSSSSASAGGDGGDGGPGSGPGSGGRGGAGGEGGEGGSEPECGNGVVEGDETCDDPSGLCDDFCQLQCPQDGTPAASYPACYFALEGGGTFFQAYTACTGLEIEGVRGRLATPRTEADLAVLPYFGAPGPRWIGAADFAVEGEFRWIGEESDFPFENQQLPWGGDNPDNADDREDCVALLPDGTLNDTGCDTGEGIVCELVPGWAVTARCGDGDPDPGEECEGGGAGDGLACEGCNLRCPGPAWAESPLDHVCFTLTNASTTLGGAASQCNDLGARLATPDDIGDVAVSRYVCDQALTDYCWLGGGRASEDAAFTWESGEPFDYAGDGGPPWKPGAPGPNGVALIMESGLLDVVGTDGARGALCELGDVDQ